MERTEYIVKSKEGYISEQALFALLFLEMTRVLPAPLARLVARCWPCSIHPVVGTTCRLRDRMHTRNYAIVSIYTIGGYGEVPFILSEGIPSVPFRFIVTVVCPLLFAAAAATLLISIRTIRPSHHHRGLLFARLETLQYYIVEKRCLLERRSTTQLVKWRRHRGGAQDADTEYRKL